MKRIVVIIALLAIVVFVFVPDTRKDLGKWISEAPVTRDQILYQGGDNRKWVGPDYEVIDVFYARRDIWQGEIISENDLQSVSTRLPYSDIRGRWCPAKEDIAGTRASAFVLAGSRFSKWNLDRTDFSPRQTTGRWTRVPDNDSFNH
ncbi:MAG: hypothetical protein AB7W16_21590 [Candidatus Obscuribacterales bacterium]